MLRTYASINESLRRASAQEVKALLHQHGEEMNLLNLITALGRIDDPVPVQELLPHVLLKTSSQPVEESKDGEDPIPTRWLCRTIFALGKHTKPKGRNGRVSANAVIPILRKRLEDSHENFAAQDIAQAAWGVVKLKHWDLLPPLIKKFSLFPEDRLAIADVRDVLWALTNCNERFKLHLQEKEYPELLQAQELCFEVVRKQWHSMKRVTDIIPILIAAEKSKHTLLKWSAQEGLPDDVWEKSRSPDKALILWSWRERNEPPVISLFHTAASELTKELWTFPADLSMAINAFGKQKLLPQCSALHSTTCLDRILTGDTQTVSNCILAFARCSLTEPAFYLAANIQLASIKQPQHVANMLYSLAVIRKIPIQTLNHLMKLAYEQVHDYRIEEYSMVLWSFAILNIQSPEVKQFAAARSFEGSQKQERQNNKAGPRELSLIAWSRAMLGTQDTGMIQYLDQLVQQCGSPESARRHLLATWNANWCSQIYMMFLSYPIDPVPWWVEPARASFTNQAHMDTGRPGSLRQISPEWTSGRHLRVFRALKSHGKENDTIRAEFSIDDMIVDLAFPEHHRVIEVDGPTHYYTIIDKDQKEQLYATGPTNWKTRQLELKGWKVIRLPTWELDYADDPEKIQNLVASKW